MLVRDIEAERQVVMLGRDDRGQTLGRNRQRRQQAEEGEEGAIAMSHGLQFIGKLDEAAGRGYYYVYCERSVDLHVYLLLLLRAPHEPLRQWSGRVRVDDHTVI